MTVDSSLFVKKIRHLSLALIISGALNIGVLSAFLYWILRERPPTPYCELKPASYEQQQISLADSRACKEMLMQLSRLSFPQLVNSLSRTQLVGNGYTERDLALACLITFHHFDIQRALPKNAQPRQQRLLTWKPDVHQPPLTLVFYPHLTQQHFNAIIQFAKTERWPQTAEGLFLLLKKQKKEQWEANLVETFMLTPEFWTVELLFNRAGQQIDKQELLALLLEGEWLHLKQFVDQQRQLHDQSDARRQKFLLDYIQAGSPLAAKILLKTDREFADKKLPIKGSEQKELAATPVIASVMKNESVPRTYVVQEGDSLWKIARRFNVEVEALKRRNELKSDTIKPGSTLKIP
jgi:LysM repeat protein